MNYWLIYVDDFSNGLEQIDIVCYINHDDAVKHFDSLEDTKDLWHHLIEMSIIEEQKEAA